MRVITGTCRGRKLLEPAGMDVRPTTDQVKEALFNIVQFDVEGRKALDLFAGTVLEMAERYGMTAPVNRMLYDRIKAMETSW